MRPLRDLGASVCAAAASAFFLALIVSLFSVDQVPAYAVAGVSALAVLSALRPADGLVAIAMGTPIAAWLGRQWNPLVAWPEALVVAFCAGYCARGVVSRRQPAANGADPLGPPVFLGLALVLASLAVQLLIDAWRFGALSLGADLLTLLRAGYFTTAASSDPIDAAMRLVESLIVFRAAASLARREIGFAPRLTAWVVLGASAAAALNMVRLGEGAARLDAPVAAFARYLLTERLNVHYADVNAAGSYFVLTLFLALGLALTPTRRLSWLAVPLIGASLWLSGSRMAYMAGLLALLLPAGAWAVRLLTGRVRWSVLAAAAITLALLAAVAAYSLPERGNQRSPLAAFQVRWELARTSVRMAASSPSFGVGIGRYYSRSGEFSSPELLQLFPPAIHENAHNNFLQILAELGVAGLAVVLWLLATAAVWSARLVRAGPADPLRWGLLTGLVAFVLSWLGSHPLLIDEPAFTFWLVLGLTAGWGLSAAAPRPSSHMATATSFLIVLVAITVPLRFVQQRADFDLEHRGVGLSAWQNAIDGVRYRLAGTSSSVFVPSSAQMIVVPLRAAAPYTDLRVEMRLDGRPADVIKVDRDRWQHLRLQLPQERHPPRFRRLELRVDDPPPGAANLLMIGKVEPR